MSELKVRDIKDSITKDAAVVDENASLFEVVDSILKDPKTQAVYVVDSDRKLIGIIPIEIITQYAYYKHIPPEYLMFHTEILEGEKATAREIMLPPVYVREEDNIEDAFVKLFENKLLEIPVVDENMKIIGDLHQLELIKAWREKN